MTIRPQLWISLGIAASLCGVLLLALGRAASPRTDRAAVMAILDQRAIAYTDVQVHGRRAACPRTISPLWPRWSWKRSARPSAISNEACGNGPRI